MGQCGAAGALGWSEAALQWRGDGEAERRRNRSFTGAAGDGATVRKNEIGRVEEYQRVTMMLW
jgi:hypothetical protein